ncbi:MAG TPA: GNAT family N-acetyltransferase [Solirubrobacteraceae bacterium]
MVELRQWTPDDAAALNEAVAVSLEHLRPWMPWASEPPMSVAARRRWIAERRREARGGGDRFYGAFEDGAIVGAGGLHARLGPGALEIGYWTHVDHVRRGVASAIVRRLCELAFAEPRVAHVEIHHDVDNVASGAVARRAGFTDLGVTGSERIWRLSR